MHILYLSYPLSDYGAPHQAMGTFWLARQGIKVTFMAWGNQNKPSYLEEYPTIDYQLIPKSRNLFSAFQLFVKLILSFFKIKPDVVYVQGAQQTPFLLWLFYVKGKTKVIYHTQDYVGPGQQLFYEWCERFFTRRADWVISNEINRARFMASSYGLKKMPLVIRTSLPSWWIVPQRDVIYRQELLIQLGLEKIENPRLIVAGGAYRSDRMSWEYVEAFAKLPDNYGLIFNSMPPESLSRQRCEQHLEKLNLGKTKRVLFIETLSYLDLLKQYAACDIGLLLYPNSGVGHFYQAPGRFTEYLRTGLALISSDFPGLKLLTLEYQLGAVANPYESMDIVRAITEVGEISNDELEERRQRLINLALNDLVYEKNAGYVFEKILNLKSDL